MAFTTEDEEEGQPQTGGPLTMESSNATSQPTQGAGVRVNRGGGQFADISRYISQNAPQAKRLASRVGSGILEQGNEAAQNIRENVAKAQGSFNQALNQGTPQFDQNLANQAATDAGSLFKKQQPIQTNQAGSKVPLPRYQRIWEKRNPGKSFSAKEPFQPSLDQVVPVDPEKFDALTAMRSAMYQGPMELQGQEGFDEANRELANVAKLMATANTPEGFQRILRPKGGSGKLDQLLLGGGQSQNILKGAAGELERENLGGLISGAESDAKLRALKAQEETALKSKDFDEMIRSGATKQFEDLKSSLPARINTLKGNISRIGARNVGPQHVLGAEDYDKLAAINALLGKNLTF